MGPHDRHALVVIERVVLAGVATGNEHVCAVIGEVAEVVAEFAVSDPFPVVAERGRGRERDVTKAVPELGIAHTSAVFTLLL